MGSDVFFGREELLADLKRLLKKKVASLVTCRGRRRIGKSTLIEKFASLNRARFLKLEGLRPKKGITDADERSYFVEKLSIQTGCDRTVPATWLDAFMRLNAVINDRECTVILLDEISWMAHGEPRFSGILKSMWDDVFKKHPKLVLVVCGSVSSWIRENLINNPSFYGRRSLDIVVPELPLSDCVKFWGRAAGRINLREISDVLSVTGGVPRYLEEIDPGATATENLRNLAFRPKSVLRTDFDEMFTDVITRQSSFTGNVLRSLVHEARTASEIAAALAAEKNGHITEALEQLAEAGIVAADGGKNPETGKDVRERRYRLADNYSRFYLRYLEPIKDTIDGGHFHLGSLEQLKGWESVLGLAFENMVVNNATRLCELIGIGGATVLSCAPYRRLPQRDESESGVQVDLLIQTPRSIYVVEIKRQREIGIEIISEMEKRVARVPHRPDVSVRTVLVYDGHLSSVVESEGYFDALVQFRELIGL